MEKVESISLDLIDRINNEEDLTQKKTTLMNFLHNNEGANTFSFPPHVLSGDLSWINCKTALTLNDLSGKLVLFDFFTYCCINCIHIMPFLHKMEKKYPISSGFTVIGVHSAKFPNEKIETNIGNAVRRYGLQHPVVNDCDLTLWEQFCVKCWPTLMLVGPDGKILFSIPGESHLSFIETFIEVALDFYQTKEKLDPTPLPISLTEKTFKNEENAETKALTGHINMQYPGKIAIDSIGHKLAVSDTGNNRVIICDTNGNVSFIIGGEEPGFVDGDFNQAKFDSPQGVAWCGPNSVFIGDCNNHAIRKIDLFVRKVVTVAGTGQQGYDLEGGHQGLDQPISSPWDVVVGGSPRFPDGESLLYIAMSGCHQIWAFFLKNADYQKGVEHEMGTCIRYAGSGNEENRNNSYPHKAGLAQPSGLALDEGNHCLYVADSESSTVRRVNLTNGAVQALVGGDIDPTNLFAFGDVDGKGRDVRLQHPLAVAWDHKRNQVYVADSYNHKIKVINPSKKTCQVMSDITCGGSPLKLNEPGGLCIDNTCDKLYIVDTNNHDIKVLTLDEKEATLLKLRHLSMVEIDGPKIRMAKPLASKKGTPVILDTITMTKNGKLNLVISSAAYSLNSEASSSWQISCYPSKKDLKLDEKVGFFLKSGTFKTSAVNETISISDILSLCKTGSNMDESNERDFANPSIDLYVECLLYYCMRDSDVCKMLSYKAVQHIQVTSDNNTEAVSVRFEIENPS